MENEDDEKTPEKPKIEVIADLPPEFGGPPKFVGPRPDPLEPDLLVDQPLLVQGFVTPDGRLLKGKDAENPPLGSTPIWLILLDTVEVPIPTADAGEFAQTHCVRTVQHPIMGSVRQFAIGGDAGLVMLEVAKALKKRDDKIDELETLLHKLADKHGWPDQ